MEFDYRDMDHDFKIFGLYHYDWLTWLGQPMLYDGGLCVNRSPEEHAESNKRRRVPLAI